MNKTLQTLEIKVENNGATPQGKIFAREWNVLVEAVKALDLKGFDEAKLLQFLRDNDFITSEDIPDIDFSNVVTLSGQQTIPGPKDFVGGIKVNGMPIVYNAELGVWEFTGDLFVTGNFAWGSSIDGFKPSTVMDAVRVDRSTIIKKKDANGDWYLYAPGGGSGGSGGGLTLGDVVGYLSDNDYTTKTDVNSLIASALVGYATQSWVEGKKYLTGITSSMITSALGFMPYNSANFTKANIISTLGISDWALASAKPTYTASEVGALSVSKELNSGSLNDYTTAGIYRFNSISDGSEGMTPYGNLLVVKGGTYDTLAQLYFNYYDGKAFIRSSNTSGLSSANWNTIAFTSDIPTKLSQLTDDVVAGKYLKYTIYGNFDADTLFNDGFHSGNILHLPSGSPWGIVHTLSYRGGSNNAKPAYATQIFIPCGDDSTSPNDMFFRTSLADAWNAWNKVITDKNIGDYNAGSATKLQTPRTIWGQSFDGNGDITHGFRSLYADNYNGGVAHSILNNQGSPYGLLTRIFGNGSVSLQAQREANDAECFNLLLNHLGGNVAIGGSTADAKLHVHGNTMVDGELYFNHKTILRLDNSNTWVNYGGANDGLDLRLCGRELIFQYGRGDAFARAMTITSGGNLAIGGSTADAKLHVYGNIITTGNIEGGIFGLQNSSPDNPLLRLTVGNQNYYVQATSDGIYLGPTSTLSLKVDANGNTTINGNLLVYGNVSWLSHSQRSLKNIISEQGLSLAQLERIRPIKFYWKDGRDMALHVGGVADVFAEVLPEVVARNLQDILCLNYVDAAFYVGASLIAPVLDHERRITKGEAEQEALKKENAKLKRELVEVKRKLNHLVA